MSAFNIFVSLLTIFILYIKKCDADSLKINIFPKEVKKPTIPDCYNGQEYYCTDVNRFRRCDSNFPVSKEASKFELKTTYVCYDERCCVPNRRSPCSLKCPKPKQVKRGKGYNGVKQFFEAPVRTLRTPSEKEFVTSRKYKFNYNDLIDLSKRMNSASHGKNCYHKIHNQEFNISAIDYDDINYLETVFFGEKALSQDNLLWEIDDLIIELDDQLKKHKEDVNGLKSKGDKRCGEKQKNSEGNLCVNEENPKDEFGMDDAKNLPHIVTIIKNFLIGANSTSINDSIIAVNYTISNGVSGMEIEMKANIPTTKFEYPVNLDTKKYNKLIAMLETIQDVYEQILIKKEVNIDDEEGMFTWFANPDLPVKSEDELEHDTINDKEDKNDKINQDHQANTDKKNKYNDVDDILADESQSFNNVKKDFTRKLNHLRNIEKREAAFFDNTDEPETRTEYIEGVKEGLFAWLSNAGIPMFSKDMLEYDIINDKDKWNEDKNDKINQDHQTNTDKKNKYNDVDEDVIRRPKPLRNIEKREAEFEEEGNEAETSINQNPLGEFMLETSINMKDPEDDQNPVVIIVGRSRNLTSDAVPESNTITEKTNENSKAISNTVENNRNVPKTQVKTVVLESNANQLPSKPFEYQIPTIDGEIDYKALYEALVNGLFKIVEEHAKISEQLLETTTEPVELQTTTTFSPTTTEEGATTFATDSTELSDYLYNLYNTTSFNSSSKKFKEYKDDDNVSKRNITEYIEESNKTIEVKRMFPSPSSSKNFFNADLENNNSESADMNKCKSPEDFFSDDEGIIPDEIYTKTVVRNKTISKNLVEDDFDKAGNRTLITIELETIANKKTDDGNLNIHDLVSDASNNFFIKEIRKTESKRRTFSIENDDDTFKDFD